MAVFNLFNTYKEYHSAYDMMLEKSSICHASSTMVGE